MVYPVSSPLQQQIPAANTFQPGGTEATKRPEENKTPDATRPANTDTARVEASATRNNGRVSSNQQFDTVSNESRFEDNGGVYGSQSRGSNLNITV